MNLRFILAAVVTALVLPTAAWAHVSVHPNALPAGGFTVVTVNVPNELSGPATTTVDVQFPSGFAYVATEALPGWKATITYRKSPSPSRSTARSTRPRSTG